MATLLHIDSSVFPGEASSSRSVTAAFRRTWEEQHPEGTVIYRDLATDPVPHITADAWSPPCDTSPDPRTPHGDPGADTTADNGSAGHGSADNGSARHGSAGHGRAGQERESAGGPIPCRPRDGQAGSAGP